MLKHMLTNDLKTIQKTHLYSRKPVCLADASYERRSHNATGVDFTGLNAAEQLAARKDHATISLFQRQLKMNLSLEFH